MAVSHLSRIAKQLLTLNSKQGSQKQPRLESYSGEPHFSPSRACLCTERGTSGSAAGPRAPHAGDLIPSFSKACIHIANSRLKMDYRRRTRSSKEFSPYTVTPLPTDFDLAAAIAASMEADDMQAAAAEAEEEEQGAKAALLRSADSPLADPGHGAAQSVSASSASTVPVAPPPAGGAHQASQQQALAGKRRRAQCKDELDAAGGNAGRPDQRSSKRPRAYVSGELERDREEGEGLSDSTPTPENPSPEERPKHHTKRRRERREILKRRLQPEGEADPVLPAPRPSTVKKYAKPEALETALETEGLSVANGAFVAKGDLPAGARSFERKMVALFTLLHELEFRLIPWDGRCTVNRLSEVL
ncbi:hypothetical protein BV25DRAFT_1838398 [Artomyces pyxidatus]|uniref:Uncharacterized protein n=1 Tax=Artomyces pyxidatus TaxID=48021 RepID=A0ACB8T3R2_9AGAM|nr:hypothetical protein BV25DRAFT_1838398 [Artomyces pyxidatus]